MLKCLWILLPLHFIPCLAQLVEVTQDKLFVVVQSEKSVELKCRHKQSSYLAMFWYQQKEQQGLKLMVHSTGPDDQGKMEEGFSHWTLNRTSVLDSTLMLPKAGAQDSAVYFCAVSQGGGTGTQYFGAGTILSVLGEKEKQIEPKVRIFPPDKQEFIEHGLISVVCVASGFFPEHVRLTWYLNNEKIESLYQNVPKSDADNTYSTSSRLSLMESQYFNPDTKIRCEARFVGSDNSTSDEIDGELGCGVSKESYGRYMNQGKISYIMVLFKSGLYAVIVVAVIWRRKALSGSC